MSGGKKAVGESQYLKEEKITVQVIGQDGKVKDQSIIVKKYGMSVVDKLKALIRRIA